ncbi:Voltage-dependent calcium channel subunit alpha-2/delta-2 [Channa argus]|uniref:Voltage-dependent calcium channel subunit alpha-2/delta-2 n=1 Tax=Channa argus TaxID=215402 RepID=A0A6G1PI24_CHAAH|nr:Voltage-dependent calcium channel subunit alpha-2/delta-2 [Channa argus]
MENGDLRAVVWYFLPLHNSNCTYHMRLYANRRDPPLPTALHISSCLGCTSVRPEQFYCRAGDPSRAKTGTFAARAAWANQIFARCNGERRMIHWAGRIEKELEKVLQHVTGIQQMRLIYNEKKSQFEIKRNNPKDLVERVARDISKLLNSKRKALESNKVTPE